MLKNYFSFKGRLNRKPYWLRNLALYGIAIVIYLIVILGFVGFSSVQGAAGLPGGTFAVMGLFGLLILPLILAFYVATFSLAARRLHDRNKSGWWLLGYVAAFAGIGGVIENFGEESTIGLVATLLGLLLFLWYLIELGFLKGTVGANKYGPDPLTGASADPSVFE